MPETNEGPAGAVEEKEVASSSAENPLPGFAESMLGFPPPAPAGEPEDDKAVETSATEKAADAAAETPKVEKTEEPAKVEAEPAPASTVNFDGLSDESKAYWDKALKAGHATPADVKRAVSESLFLQSWSRAHGKLSKERESFKAEMLKVKEDLDTLAKVRSDPKRHAAYLKAVSGDFSAEDPADETEDPWKRVEKVADARIAARERERATRTEEQDRAYEARKTSMSEAINERMALLSIPRDSMLAYLKAEEGRLNGADPILRYGSDPAELMDRVQMRHEAATAKAEAAALKEQLSQRASKQVQSSKQSLQPPRRNTDPEPTGLGKILKEAGVSRLTDIAGFGWGPDGNAR